MKTLSVFHRIALVTVLTVCCSVAFLAQADAALPFFQISDAVNTPVPQEATRSDIVYNLTSAQWFVVWEQEDSLSSDVYGRVLAVDGTPITAPFQISPPETLDTVGAGHPAVAWNDTDNEYLVVWESDATGFDDFEIWGHRVSTTGTLLDTAFVLSTTVDDARHADVAYSDSTNQYLVVWQADVSNIVVDVDIYGQRVSAAGAEVGGDFRISFHSNPAANRTAFDPAVTSNSIDKEYLVLWTSDGPIGDNRFEVFGVRLDVAGAALSAAFRISDMTIFGLNQDGFEGAVAYNSTENHYLFGWCGDGSNPSTRYETWGQISQAADPFVLVVMNDFVITQATAAGTTRDSYHPAVIHNGLGNFYVAFGEADGGALADGIFEVFVRRIDAAGNVGAPEVQISCMSDAGADRDARLSSVAYNLYGDRYMVTWNGDGHNQADNDDEIFAHRSSLHTVPVFFGAFDARIVDRSVELAWDVTADEPIQGFRIYRRANDKMDDVSGLLDPDARSYNDTGAQIGTPYSYYVAVVMPGGDELLSVQARVTISAGPFALDQNYPNPFNPTTTIAYNLPQSAHVTLVVYDVAGREVTRLINDTRPAGPHQLQWNGRNTRGVSVVSGTYFYKITAQLQDGRTLANVKKLVLTK